MTSVTIAETLGVEERSVRRRAAREGWQCTKQRNAAGRPRFLYLVSSLPDDVRARLAEGVLASAASAAIARDPSSSEPGLPLASADAQFSSSAASHAVGSLAQWQVEIATARAELIAECERVAAAASIGVTRAESILVERARAGELPERLAELARVANARRGSSGRSLSVQRLSAWRKQARGAMTPAERLARLAPRGRGKRWTLEPEVTAALAKYRDANKPSLRWCVAEIVGGETAPDFGALYARCRRELAKLPAPLFYAGRHTGAALKALLPFRRREFLSLAPNDVWVGDGHSAKLRIAHPETGAPFVPEVTVILDVPTRYVVGWSVSLSENCLAVSDALRHGVSRHGIPLVYYSDGGAGQTAKMFDAPVTGILAGLGVHHEVGRPGNPQARGVIERLWRTILIPLARRFATFRGEGADRETLRRVTIEIDRELKAARKLEGAGQVTALPRRLPSFHEFLAALEAEVEAYNATHTHRSLPKLDGANHATPSEYRASRLAGAAPVVPQPAELGALFMPSVRRIAMRGEVRLWNGVYFHRDLMLIDREEVAVCYDIHDASFVLVRRLSGELIARAELAGNRSGYMPQPFLERLRDERAKRRRGRLEAQLEEVDAERRANTLPSIAAASHPPVDAPGPEELARLEREFVQAVEQPADEQPIETMDEMQRYYLWKDLHARRARGESLSERHAAFYAGFEQTGRMYLEEELAFERNLERPTAQKEA